MGRPAAQGSEHGLVVAAAALNTRTGRSGQAAVLEQVQVGAPILGRTPPPTLGRAVVPLDTRAAALVSAAAAVAAEQSSSVGRSDMAHFAEIDANNIVLRVLVVHNDDEHRGQEFLADDLGLGGTWIQTSYNTVANTHQLGGTPLHMNYAGVGYTWDGTGFAVPSPYGSWSLDENYVWQPPTPMPDDGNVYGWDEDTTSWVEVTE